MASERVARLLRLPKELDERIGERASENDRSINAEVIRRLRESIEADERRQSK